ncbi:hypothetical protein NQ318_020012 [Aromia moschata]|uniref:DNA repair protein complementing XP-G cells homolog n=1 Tax=Aromia moschata TaxID=1265417 RepID=A0AAV8ZBN7_9CUCU|nr:hypothetical protein NQ318_020012 [Aromia moschata]
MGVHGLWHLIDSSGRPVPLETLENKVLAVDISIWLHQAVKGFQDSKGAPLPNAHLLGIYHRVCKLLYFKVKPVFVFDGTVPALKKETIAKRNQQKSKNISEAERLQKQLLSALLKHSAKPGKHESLYVLPPSELDSTLSSSEDDDSEDTDSSPTKHWDLHTIDMSSSHFRSLPVDVRHEILTDLKETRKQSSWGRLHEMPKQSDQFSGYQMKRLLKRQAVQSALEDAEKEMGGHSLSLAELESVLKDHGVATVNDMGRRIASDENTRFLYIKDVKQALEKARQEQWKLETKESSRNDSEDVEVVETQPKNKADVEFEEDLQKAIALSLGEGPSTSGTGSDKGKVEFSFLENFNDADFQSDFSEEDEENVAKKDVVLRASGLTPNEIAKIMNEKGGTLTKKSKEKKAVKKTVEKVNNEIVTISDDSSDFIKVPVEENKSDSKRTESEKSRKTTEEKFLTISDSSESNAILLREGKLERENVEKPSEIITDQVISDNKEPEDVTIKDTKGIESDLQLKGKGSELFELIEGSEQAEKSPSNIRETSKETGTLCINKNTEENAEIVNKPPEVTETEKSNFRETEPIDEKSNTGEENIDNVEVMSDSGESSSSVEFLEVSEHQTEKKSLEIVVDPKEKVYENDLFSDIFGEKKDDRKKEALEILIDPQSKPEDGLFDDIFEDKDDVGDTSKAESAKTEILNKGATLVIKNKLSIISETEVSIEENTKNEAIAKEEVQKVEESAEMRKESKGESVTVRRQVEKIEKLKLSVEEMQDLQDNLRKETDQLMVEKSTRERMATNITDQMYQEAQELLELFGMPYIVAPMEAEAQCAFLDASQLTQGTITDDSDIWLFGGRTVYKNFFNQSKYVMEFKDEDIRHHFKLAREQMVLLALLVGSDYTAGVQGVGPVTALEILAAFPPSKPQEFTLSHAELLSGLREFHGWLTKGKTAGPGRLALRNKLKNVVITENFPSAQVVQAYLEPTVDTSREKFTWGKPDFASLTDFAREKFGWTAKKTEEILKPVIKRMEEKKIQASIKDYFKTTHKVDSGVEKNKMSKRVKTAVERIGKTREELIADEMEALSKEAQKKARGRKQSGGESKNSRKKKAVEENAAPKEEPQKPKRSRTRRPAQEVGDLEDFEESRGSKPTPSAPKLKKLRKKDDTEEETSTATADREEDELRRYEDMAKELKKRRQRRNELKEAGLVAKKLAKKVVDDEERAQEPSTSSAGRRNEETAQPNLQTGGESSETVPRELEADVEVRFFQATASRSAKRAEEIEREAKKELGKEAKKTRAPALHQKEVIHQRLRDKSDVLRNKLKAIEVFRKSKKGPGYVGKLRRTAASAKEDAGLSDDSSDE